MVLQNESVDEELEHFEDIMEADSNEPNTTSKKEEQNNQLVQRSDEDNPKSNSSEDEDEDDEEDEDEEEEEESPSSASDDNVSDEADEFLVEDSSEKIKQPRQQSVDDSNQPKKSSSRSNLPGGYDPRHREPSYSNADRASWWELQVIASHAHPSVATMAGTLLSGANIVYNGNPLNDLSLTAFLDKFMEKKPKQTTWHGGSQIEPAKKLDMSNHLIGPEILSVAEADVPPEDLVFHKFYVNKMNTLKPKKKKKKKKGAEEEAAEELFGVDDGDEVDGGDESDNEEIEYMLDAADHSLEADTEYDYDDLDQVADEDDDDDLVGNASDAEMDVPSDIEEGEGISGIISDGEDDAEDVDINIGDADDGSDDVGVSNKRKRKPKSGGKAGSSPFASLEDYEHLLNEDDPSEKKSATKKSTKRKKHKK